MQTNNSKNQLSNSQLHSQQLPSQVVAEIKLPFNPDIPSSVPKERIIELNQLAKNAFLNTEKSSADYSIMHDLIVETCALKEVHEELSDIGEFGDFYYHIDSAFALLIADNPSNIKGVFQTYKDLTSLFRVIEKQKVFIQQKWQELERVMGDINILDSENVARYKASEGGLSC